MPWKENNNGKDPWGDSNQRPPNNSKKKNYNFNIDNLLNNFFSKIKKIFFNGGPANKKSFISAALILLIIWIISGFCA